MSFVAAMTFARSKLDPAVLMPWYARSAFTQPYIEISLGSASVFFIHSL